MRYTRIALLVFGLGLLLGFVVVVGEFARFERAAAALMALGLIALPAALFADGRALALRAWVAARLPRGRGAKSRRKPRAATTRPAGPRRKAPARGAGVRRGRR